MRTALLLIMLLVVVALSDASPNAKTELPKLRIPDCLGANIHFTRADAKELDLLRDGGFKFIRMDFFWHETEKEKGVYRFDDYDYLVDSLANRGIRPLFILDYSNRLYETDNSVRTPEGRAAYAKWAAAAAKRYAGRGVLWEFWNEPNIFFWQPQPGVDEYSKMVAEAALAIKKADPGAFVVAPATSGVALDYIEEFFRRDGLKHIDAVTVHPYRQDLPETAADELRALRALIERYRPSGKRIDILSGEWGYSSIWGGFDEAKQGRFLARQWLSNLANGVRLSIWYDWHDDGPDPKEPEHHFGTVKLGFEPKPAYVAARTLTSTLNGYEPFTELVWREELPAGASRPRMVLFRKGDEFALAAWCETEGGQVSMTVPLLLSGATSSVATIGAFGERGSVTVSRDGTSILRLTQEPVYILLGKRASPALTWRFVEQFAPTAALGRARFTIEFFNSGKPTTARLVRTGASDPFELELNQGWTKYSFVADISGAVGSEMAVVCSGSMGEGNAVRPAHHPQTRRAYALIRDPFLLTLAPVSNDRAVLTIEHPFARSDVEGEVSYRDFAGSSVKAPLVVRPDVRNTAVVRAGAGGRYDVTVTVRGKPTQMIGKASGRLVAFEDFADASEKWLAEFDGDTKVKAEATASIAPPPKSDTGLAVRIDRALRVDYRFDIGWKFLQIRPPADGRKIAGRPVAVGIWIYGDGKRNWIRCRFRDSTGQTHQPNYGVVDWIGWKYITMPLAHVWHWGGASDGQVHYPIEWDCPVLVDSAGTTKETSTIYIGPIFHLYE